jgi:hypothetical protein
LYSNNAEKATLTSAERSALLRVPILYIVHFALGLDGRRRHGTDGRRVDESESAQESLRSLTHQKLEELQ